MLNCIRKILSVLALASIAIFVVAVPVLLVMGKLAEQRAWVIGPFCAFLVLGLATLGVNWLMKKMEEKRKAEEDGAET